MAVVKSNGYGLGAVPLAGFLSEEGISSWAVGNIDEGIELRQAGIGGDILLLGHMKSEEPWFRLLHDHALLGSVNSLEDARNVAQWCRSSGRCLKVHVQTDVGMGRLGIAPGRIGEALRSLSNEPNVRICGIYGHPAAGNAVCIHREHDRFQFAIGMLPPRLQTLPTHFANSAALVAGVGLRRHRYARLGIALLGGGPQVDNDRSTVLNDNQAGCPAEVGQPGAKLGWTNVVTIHSHIVQLRKLQCGDTVSYDGTFRAIRRSIIATVPVGYADGLPVSLSNQLVVAVQGRLVRQVGRITMNYLMLDVTDSERISVGDSVTIGDAHQPFCELARLAGHLHHELLTRLPSNAARYLV